MSGLTVKHKIEDVNEDGIELVLADVSILEDHQDVLYNPGISDRRKAENNQRIRKIVKVI
jgi:SART-1 family